MRMLDAGLADAVEIWRAFGSGRRVGDQAPT